MITLTIFLKSSLAGESSTLFNFEVSVESKFFLK